MRNIRRHRFRGKNWAILFERVDAHNVGLCEEPTAPDKTIIIDPRMDGLGLLDTAIHEALHACLWDLDEDAVTETAWDIARFVHRLGFHREE